MNSCLVISERRVCAFMLSSKQRGEAPWRSQGPCLFCGADPDVPSAPKSRPPFFGPSVIRSSTEAEAASKSSSSASAAGVGGQDAGEALRARGRQWAAGDGAVLTECAAKLRGQVERLEHVTDVLTSSDKERALINAYEYMTLFGHTVIAWQWLRLATAAARALEREGGHALVAHL